MNPKKEAVSLDAMWEHLESLAARHGITLDTRMDRPADAYAVPGARIVCITPLRSAVGYATALHEIGHVIHGHQGDDPEHENEREAWEWAKANARVWTPGMERCRIQSLAALKQDK